MGLPVGRALLFEIQFPQRAAQHAALAFCADGDTRAGHEAMECVLFPVAIGR